MVEVGQTEGAKRYILVRSKSEDVCKGHIRVSQLSHQDVINRGVDVLH